MSDETISALELTRNIGILAHVDAGKTTTTERMLYYSGKVRAMGNVDDGDTVTDFMDQERERGITIRSASIAFEWRGHKINLIDTPGHVDFTSEVEASLRVLDGAVVLVDAVAGVQAQTRTVWDQCNRYDVPRIVFVNKMDKDSASMANTVQSLLERLPPSKNGQRIYPLVVHAPVFASSEGDSDGLKDTGDSSNFIGLIDLVRLEKVTWGVTNEDEDGSRVYRECLTTGGTPALYAYAVAKRVELVERLADVDDAMEELFLEFEDTEHEYRGRELSLATDKQLGTLTAMPVTTVAAALKRLTRSSALRDSDDDTLPCVVMCGSSLANKGVQPLLDAVVDYLPHPGETVPPMATRVHDGRKVDLTEMNSTIGLAFKALYRFGNKHPLIFMRLYGNGALRLGDSVTNVSRLAEEAKGKHRERIQKIFEVNADQMVELPEARAGSIVAVVGPHSLRSGDTLMVTAGSKQRRSLVSLDGFSLAPPVFTAILESESATMEVALKEALAKLNIEDPSLHVTEDEETGQTRISGMGELHLEVVHERLKREFGLNQVRLASVKVAYRETPTSPSTGRHVFSTSVGNKSLYAQVEVQLSSLANDEGHIPSSNSVPSTSELMQCEALAMDNNTNQPVTLSNDLVEAVVEGVEAGLAQGCPGEVAGMPIIGTKVELLPGGCRVDSSTNVASMKAAAARAVVDAARNAQLRLVEPVMQVTIDVPEERSGVVMSDVTGRRRGTISEILVSDSTHMAIVHALLPLSAVIGYSSSLRSLTAGEASFSVEFAHYHAVEEGLQERVLRDHSY